MSQPPPDPNAFTQPIPIVPPQPQRQPTPGAPPPGAAAAAPYVHRFGNVPFYLVSRLGAFLVDVFGVAFLISTFGFHAFETGYLAYGSRDEGGFLALAGISLGIAFALAYLSEALLGTTLGKALFGLHTRAVDGRHAGGGRVFMRYLLRPVDLLVIGPLLALVTPRHRHLGDFAGGTVVGRSRFGALTPIVGILLVAALTYGQIAYGGGLTSAIEVLAEASNFTPGLIAKGAHAIGLAGLPLPAVSVPAPVAATSGSPSAAATPAGATLFATAPAVATPAAAASEAPASALPDASESPSDSQTDEPQAQPTNRIINQ
jgi:uncharacterized RDD family membrane protein YckC